MKINVQKLIDDKDYCEEIFEYYLKIKVLKKTNPHLFLKNINKSIKNLEFANFILDEHKYSIKEKLPGKTFYDWSITIYYYSIYHIILAMIEKTGYTSKSHLATITTIILLYYHKSNLIQKEDIKFIIKKIDLERDEINMVLTSKSLRERACYGVDLSFELSQTKIIQK